jgi:hypothetical protein
LTSFRGLLAAVDADGALREAHAEAESFSRARALALAAGGTAFVLGATPRRASAATRGDVAILNYALVLEYLQASFYTEAERTAALVGSAARAAREVGAVERAHVKAFLKLLGPKAVKRPAFNFQGTTEQQQAFLKTAVAFEDLAVAAYKGQAPAIESDDVLAAAVAIHTVEARHAAWMRYLFGIRPAESAFDDPKSKPQIERIVASTHFVSTRPRTRGRRKPRFTG